jgi:hypothetical protein
LIPCAAIGDSIAVGVGQARPECVTTARVGITSGTYINSLLPLAEFGVDTTIISLGVNDGSGVDTLTNLRTVRNQVTSRVVYWLLPGLKDEVRADIRTVAAENGDRLIDTRPYVGRDHLHPNGAGYQQIASQSYGDGAETAYAAAQPAPVEVAEAPAHFRVAGEPAFHIDYAQIPTQRASHTGERSVWYFNAPHRLSRLSTPRERIRSLRETARSESHMHYGYGRETLQVASRGMRLPPVQGVPVTRHGSVASHFTLPIAAHMPMQAASHAPVLAPVHPATVHSGRTAQVCTGGQKACGWTRSARG